MPIPGSTFRGLLAPNLQSEFDQMAVNVNQFINVEHNDDGTHGAITADSLTLNADGYVQMPDGSRIAIRDGQFVILTNGVETGVPALAPRLVIRDTELGGATGVDFEVANGDATSFAPQRLRLTPQSSYAPSASDTTAFNDATYGPNFSVYRITDAQNIEGIYTTDLTNGHRGQILIGINDSGGTVSAALSGIVSNARKILGGPVSVQDRGVIAWIYDNEALGWQVLFTHKSTDTVWQTYTPVWSSSGTQPTLGTGGTVAGRYTSDGRTVEFYARISLGTGFSFGTGNQGVTLPTTVIQTDNYGQLTAFALDVGTANYPLTSILATLNGNACATFQTFASPMGIISATVPFTFVAGDQLRVYGKYRVS